MRKLAAFVAQTNPDILAVCEIGSGDARSLATRFAMQWAYRGRQAIMWTHVFAAQKVYGRYLPAPHPFQRRGFVRVDGALDQRACSLMTTQFATARSTRAAQLRVARSQLQEAAHDALFFALVPGVEMRFDDVGFRDESPAEAGHLRVYKCGLDALDVRAEFAIV